MATILKKAVPEASIFDRRICNVDFFTSISVDKTSDPFFRFDDKYWSAIQEISKGIETTQQLPIAIFCSLNKNNVIFLYTKKDFLIIHYADDETCQNKLKWLATDVSKRLGISRCRNDAEEIALQPKSTVSEENKLKLLSFVAFAKILRRPGNSILAKLKNLERTLLSFEQKPKKVFAR